LLFFSTTFTNRFVIQILENWRSKRYIDPQKIDDVLSLLDARPKTTTASEPNTSTTSTTSSTRQALSRNDVNKRIEQDRERHKRLRERRWVQPTLHNPVSFQPPQLACFYPLTEPGGRQEELALDIEFENEWEATSDWNEDDEEAIKEEADLGFPESNPP
jgi:CTD kinase subunit gamma